MITVEDFKAWLREKGVYDQYVENFDPSYDNMTLWQEADLDNWIATAFSWGETPERGSFWSSLDDQWWQFTETPYTIDERFYIEQVYAEAHSNGWEPARMDFPPLNEFVEVRIQLHKGSVPFKAEVKYISGDVVVLDAGEGDFAGETKDYEFRLIQTEKDAAIKELSARLYQIHWAGIPSPEDMAETVWGLGYRKRISREEAKKAIQEGLKRSAHSILTTEAYEGILDELGFKE